MDLPNQRINPLDSLQIAIEGLTTRNEAVAANIANVNTPNYKAKLVTFEDELQKAQQQRKDSDIPLKVTSSKHFSNTINSLLEVQPNISEDPDGEFTLNGNNVNIEREMLEMTKTGLRFKAIADITKRHFDQLRGVIRG